MGILSKEILDLVRRNASGLTKAMTKLQHGHATALVEGTGVVIQRVGVKTDSGWSQNGAGDNYKVTVDYDQSIEQMIAAGRYDWSNSDITDKHFPVEGSGTVAIDIELVHYGRDMSKDAVLKDLDARGLRPIKIEELLALGAAKPELQREFPIIALGSVWQDLNGRCLCPYLRRDGSGRDLSLGWFDDGFFEVCRFGAVRK